MKRHYIYLLLLSFIHCLTCCMPENDKIHILKYTKKAKHVQLKRDLRHRKQKKRLLLQQKQRTTQNYNSFLLQSHSQQISETIPPSDMVLLRHLAFLEQIKRYQQDIDKHRIQQELILKNNIKIQI